MRPSIRKGLTLGLGLLAFGCMPSGSGGSEAIVLQLYDVSGSFNTGAPNSPLSRAAQQFPKLIKLLAEEALPTPQRHAVAVIGGQSYADLLCDFPVAPQLFFRDDGSTARAIDQCAGRIARHPPSPATDIAGALDFASRVLQSAGPRTRRALLIFTDLVEARRPDSPAPAPPDLHGTCVYVVWTYTTPLRREPSKLDDYLSSWRRLLVDAGSSQVHFDMLSTDLPEKASAFFRGCKANR